ncbi:MAG: hypothetical protein JNK89_00115, partial [Saprospiraceae bacterium]|nr:hypothetical protein [Saprospiraceae bacterium]
MTKTLLVPCMLLQVFLAQAQIQIATDTTWGLSFSQNGPFDLPIYVVTNCLNEAYIDAQCGPDYGSPMVPTHFADCPGMKPLWVAPAPANCYYPPTGDYWFKKEFNLCGQVLSAMAKVQADQKFTFYLNGTLIGASGDSDWDKLLTYNVTSLLKPGPNTVLIRADNIDGGSCFNYAFLAFCLQINTNNGPLVLTPMADLSACSGQPVQLQATPGGVTYAWSPDASLSSTKIANPTASPATTTTYTVTITDACGNTLTDDVMVSVLPAPAAAAANSGPYCPGDTVLLQASGGTSYFWNGPAGFSSSQQNPVLPGFSAAAAGVYSVAVFSADGCSSTASTLVTALSLASITINYPPKLCITAPPLQLVANPPGGVWGGAAAPNGLIDPSALGSGSHSFTYTYTPGSINCTSLVFRTFEIVDVPQVEIQEAGPFCIGSEVQSLVARPPGGAWGGAAFQFGLFDPTAQGLGLHGVTYTVVAAPGCSATDSITVEVIDAP